jgi:nitrite reductase/ring-hydroxylating ferredoxin subunit
MARFVVAAASEIPPGRQKLVTVSGREIGIYNVSGKFYGLFNKCPHEGASLCHGDRTGLVTSKEPGTYEFCRHGELLRCPWHGWEFDIATGQSWCDPARMKVKSYEVNVEHGEQLVKGPYVAETIKVELDGDYIVVDL